MFKDHNQILNQFTETIFTTMSNLALKSQAINLGQGFPDFDGAPFIFKYVLKAMESGLNQYAPMPGLKSLRNTISGIYKEKYQINYDPENQITITNGATEAIFCSIQAICNPGDEVIIFEPFYDSYVATIKLAHARPIGVNLNLKDNFTFKEEELEKAFSQKTKAIIVNSPHNPTGKVFSQKELQFIVNLAKKYNAYIISDEVYEHLTYDCTHFPVAHFENAYERTITISSTGKTFGLTGWKIGWVCTSSELSRSIRHIHQFNTFSVCHPMQQAMHEALEELDHYLIEFKQVYRKKRDLFVNGLRQLNLNPWVPQGTYFVVVPIENQTTLNDIEYCKKLIIDKKVAAIPPSVFYLNPNNEGQRYIRFCFAKRDDTLFKALKNLEG